MSRILIIIEKIFDLLNPKIEDGKKNEYVFAFLVLFLASVALTILIVTFVANGSWIEAGSAVSVLLIFLFSIYLLRSGYLARAMWIAIIFAHLSHLTGMTLTSGLNDPTFQAVYIVFIGAFYFLGYRSVLVIMATVIIWAISLYFAELLGLISYPLVRPSSEQNLLFSVFMMLLTGIIFYFTLLQLTNANEQLRKAKEAADAANVAKSSFLAMMSHELRTPLHSIIGYSNLVKEELQQVKERPLSSDEAEELFIDLDQIERSGRHLLALIGDILEVSKSEANADRVVHEAIDIVTLCKQVAYTVRFRVADNENRLELDLPEEATMVKTDGQKIRLVLTNLLQNSAKFTYKGTIRLSFDLLPYPADRTVMRFIVSDTGVGIAPEMQEKIFEPFYQVDTGYARSADGTGLGLNISQKMVRLLNGTITVESNVGHGARFTILLPAEFVE